MEFQRAIGSSSVGITYGIFPPLECETAAPLDSTDLIEWSFSIALCDDNSVKKEEKMRTFVHSLGIGIDRQAHFSSRILDAPASNVHHQHSRLSQGTAVEQLGDTEVVTSYHMPI